MCAPCKILINGRVAQGKIDAYLEGVAELNKRGQDLSDKMLAKSIDLICGFDEAMDELLTAVHKGPWVPFESKVR